MMIGLNALDFLPGVMGGIETYFRNLLYHLQQVDRRNRYVLLCIRPQAKEFSIFNPGFAVKEFPFGRPSPGWYLRGVLRRSLQVDPIAPLVRRLPLDVVHHPFSVIHPENGKIPSVLTFWDLQHEFYPEFFPREEREYRSRVYRSSVAGATRIITAAEFTARSLVERYGVDREKIDIVPLGCGASFRVLDDPRAAEGVRRKYGLEAPFLFYPAATWPHKNHKTLLSALKLMKDRNRFDGKLVLTGIAKEGHPAMLRGIDEAGLTAVVKVLGYVSREDLPALYNVARILVFPSLFEGFGIPLLEAMACGCPVVCSDAATLPEIVGEAGVLFDPVSPEEIAERILRVWEDEGLRQEMRRAGMERAKRFTWEAAARKTVEVYEKAIASGK